jgi:hypothetical protein
MPSAAARPAALRDTSGPSACATVTRPASFQSMPPAPSTYRSDPAMTPPARAAHTNPWCGLSTWRARNGSQRPTLMRPRMRSRALTASGVPGAIAWARWRRTGSGSPSSSASPKMPGGAGRSSRPSSCDNAGAFMAVSSVRGRSPRQVSRHPPDRRRAMRPCPAWAAASRMEPDRRVGEVPAAGWLRPTLWDR